MAQNIRISYFLLGCLCVCMRKRERESVYKRESRRVSMSLASHQIYNLHFYIIGLCLCCLLIVHPRLLIFSKWQSSMGKYFNKPLGKKKRKEKLDTSRRRPVSQKEKQNERPPSDGIHTAEPRHVSVLLISHSFNRISFRPGQDTKQTRFSPLGPCTGHFFKPSEIYFSTKWK